jgi:hypothetical protein
MRTLTVGLALLLCFGATAYGQSLEDRLAAKLKKPFLKNAAWVYDFAEAKRKAKDRDTVIFAYFTRSYAP